MGYLPLDSERLSGMKSTIDRANYGYSVTKKTDLNGVGPAGRPAATPPIDLAQEDSVALSDPATLRLDQAAQTAQIVDQAANAFGVLHGPLASTLGVLLSVEPGGRQKVAAAFMAE
jgi:hypothetical protein